MAAVRQIDGTANAVGGQTDTHAEFVLRSGLSNKHERALGLDGLF